MRYVLWYLLVLLKVFRYNQKGFMDKRPCFNEHIKQEQKDIPCKSNLYLKHLETIFLKHETSKKR